MPYSSKQFSYSKEDREFATESSTLDIGAAQSLPRMIAIESDKTKSVAHFTYSGVTRDEEGDVQFWTYYPTVETVRKNPGLNAHKLIVFND
jgi:hypothetical protein